MEWTNELVLEFLELYEEEPAIWNSSYIQHKNRNDLYDAWLRIKNKLSTPCSISDLKKESLMSSFRTCLKRVQESSKSGAGASDIYKPTWFVFETMTRFLRNKDEPKKTINSEVSRTVYLFFISYGFSNKGYMCPTLCTNLKI